MNIILSSVFIHFLLLTFLDATALKLIPGDRSVVKKDGVTHTISKYYVVPNDFDVNKDTTNNRYTKNMDQDIVSEEHYRSGNDKLEEHRSMDQGIVSEEHNYRSGNDKLGEYRNMDQGIVSEEHYRSGNDKLEEYRSMDQGIVNEEHNYWSGNDKLEAYRSMDQGIVSEEHNRSGDGQLAGYKVTVNNTGHNLLGDTGLTEVQAGGLNQSDSNVGAVAWVKLEKQERPSWVSANIGNLQVEPVPYINTNNISIENNLHNISEKINDSAFDTHTKKQIKVDSDAQQTKLTEFRFVVIESFNQNFDSFWAVFNNYVKAISDKNEQLVRIEKLFVLLNVFTSLYKAAQLDIPIEGMINEIFNVLQIADIKNSDTNKDGFQIKPAQNSNRECLRKCVQKPSKANLDSKGVSISETDGQMASDDLQKANLDTHLKRENSNADNITLWVKLHPSGSVSNKPVQIKVKAIDKPVTIQKSILKIPNYLRKIIGKPDGYNVRSAMPTTNQKQIARENGVYEDSILNLNILDTVESSKLPYRIEDKKISYLPRIKEDEVTNDLPWHIEDKVTNNLPWHIEDKVTNNLPWHIEDKVTNNLPWHIEDKVTDNLPWHIEDKAIHYQPAIEKKFGTIPLGLYPSDGSGLTLSDDEILLDSNQTPLTSTVNGLTVKNRFGKPYLYTYIINPSKFLYSVPDISSNIVKIKSGKYNNNFETESVNGYDISNTYDQESDSKIVFINSPSSGHYEPELSLSEEPRFVYSNEPGYYEAQLKIVKDIKLSDHDNDNNNLITYLPNIAPTHHEPKITVELDTEIHNNPAFLHQNSPSYEPIVKPEPEKDYGVPITQEIDADFEILLPNVPSTLYESKLKDEISTPLIDDTEPYNNNVRPFSTPLNNYEPKSKINNNPTILHPNIPTHEYIHIEKEYKLPTSGYGGEIDINSENLIPNQPFEHTVPNLPFEHTVPNQPFEHTVPNQPFEHIVPNQPFEHTVPNQPFGHTVPFLIKPSISYLLGNQPVYDYVERLKVKLAPSYQLFNTENLLKLQEVLIKRQQINQINVHEDKALTNLKNINIILLKLAAYLGENGLNNKWYENIFYNVKNPRHPLQVYVHNLLRQKWLHEIMLLLYNNNYNLNILNNPRLHSFLKAWQFPNNVWKYFEGEVMLQSSFNTPVAFEETFGAQNVLQDNIDILEEELVTEEALENFGTESVMDDYRTQNDDVFVSVTGFKPTLDANAIIEILKNHLLYKNYVETQEQIINRGNKIEMFKQIAFFLNEKGYGGRTIIDLIHKLYRTVYSVEGGGCKHTQNNNFVQNAYDVIVPVLRRAGQ